MKVLKQISTSDAPKAIGPYSQAVSYGDLLFLSGQIALDKDSGLVVGNTIDEQTEQVIKNIGGILKASGSSLSSVIKTTCFLADMAHFTAFNAVYETAFVSKPARSLVAVKTLPKGVLVEIEVIAAIQK